MSEPFSRFEGHPIFRNQPPHSFFNKSFDHPTDALYLGLNDIEPLYLKKGQFQNDPAFESNVLLDPRTKLEVQQIEYDHTRLKKPKLFRCSRKSSLTKAQHVMCVRVLKAWQQREEVEDMDLVVWRRLERKRQIEKQQMAKFIFEYGQTHKERIYAPTKKLVELYKKWYTQQVEMCLQSTPNVAFNTHTGLPHVRVCRSDSEQRMEMGQVRLLKRKGWVRVWANTTSIDCQQMHRKVESFAEYYNKGFYEKEAFLEKEIKQHLEAHEEEESNRFYIPLESLLFLLTAGDYPDLSTECLLEIKEGSSEESKLVAFQKPLPSRNCGWHTHKQVVDQAFAAYLSVSESTKWLRIDNDEVVRENSEESKEIEASLKQEKAYQALKFEDFLQKYKTVFKPKENKLKFNAALVKWQLKPTADMDNGLDILTTLELPPALNESASQFLGSHSIKLEYKTQFGCETMTKYELLKLWLQMRLMQHDSSHTSEMGKCYRIAVDTFETHLEEELTLPQLEHQLANVFHLNMSQLLSNLAEFLRLLLNMPVGKYMLRYTPKYKDKFLLCAPSQEITQNTIFLHNLLKEDPSDLLFMTQPQYLPIDELKCSSVHLYHRVLPCAFLPELNSRRKPILKSKKQNVPTKILSDSDFLAKRIQEKKDVEKAKFRRLRRPGRGSKSRKKRRLHAKEAESEQQAQDDEELQRDMAADKLLYADWAQ